MTSDNKEIFREHGEGWEALLAPVIVEADRVGATLTQVKEKYGKLRVYFDPGAADTDALEDLIDHAEAASATVCELCGKPGVLMVKGSWLKTLCPEDATYLSYKEKA